MKYALLFLVACSSSAPHADPIPEAGTSKASLSPFDFFEQAKTATCDRVLDCCPGSSRAKCESLLVGSSGYENSLWSFGVFLVDPNKMIVDEVKAAACISKLQGRPCENTATPSAIRKDLIQSCFLATSGTEGVGDSCRADGECQPGLWCDGTCKALPLIGQPCKTTSLYTDNCSYLGSGDTGLYCKAGVCVAQVSNGGVCALAMQCAGYACTGTCNATFIDPGLCSYVVP